MGAGGPGVAARHGQHVAFPCQGFKPQRRFLAAGEADAEVGIPFEYGVQHLGGTFIDDMHLDVGLLYGKLCQQVGEQIDGHGRNAGDGHAPAAQFLLVVHALDGLFQARQGGPRLLQELLANRRQFHVPGGAFQQACSHGGLQAFDATAQCRRRQEQGIGSVAEAGFLSGHHKGNQLAHVEFDALHAIVSL